MLTIWLILYLTALSSMLIYYKYETDLDQFVLYCDKYEMEYEKAFDICHSKINKEDFYESLNDVKAVRESREAYFKSRGM